ncbi:proteasome assembly chaperone 3-like [Mizuhopecten yessoensis]|uniref:Proteasome assembly chaperone 3 n=1 Tax=Mizuhopecten yessoensis TaxID=6573 RepID=A0A210QBF0_MIZYE|nr:proteasome assembly chaperone 3-like [Mizuhopecten yessoensis]OWF46045.1 Proteasome assembly chaperone 3 [Mizuhopecten yessoensis]
MDAPKDGKTGGFPVKTTQKTVMVNDHKTDILCSHFTDKLFVVVTQFNKLGNLIELKRDVVVDDAITTSRPSYSTKVLMGRDEPLMHVLAKNVMGKLDIKKPVVLALALKDESPKSVAQLSEAVKGMM